MTPDIILQEINKLNIAEKVLLLERVWDSIGESSDSVPSPQWQQDELDNRLTEHQQNSDGDLPEHEFHQQLRISRSQYGYRLSRHHHT